MTYCVKWDIKPLHYYYCWYKIIIAVIINITQADLARASWGHASTNVLEHSLFCKKTDFMTNWPTPGVVQMQKKLSAPGIFAPLTRGSGPGHGGSVTDPCAHHVALNSVIYVCIINEIYIAQDRSTTSVSG